MRTFVCLVLGAWIVTADVCAEPAGRWSADGIIDAHAHIGSFSGYEIGLDPLLPNMRCYGIRMALTSNIDGAALPGTTRNLSEVEANTAMAAAVKEHRSLKGIAWARPGAPGAAAANLEPFLKAGFVAIKLHPRFNNFPADAAIVDPYMQLAQAYHVPVVIHCDDPAPILRLAQRHPQVPVVLYHSGFFTDHQDAIRTVEDALKKKAADLYLETAQVEPEAVLQMVKRVGAARVIFGTDATYFGKDHYAKYEPMVKLLKEKLKAEEFRAVMSGNAERVFRLESAIRK
jgi:predicted TIM-barrel fold metal-dependent hydrolase